MSTDVRENWSCDEEISLSSSLWIALTNTENLYLKKKKQNQRKNFLSIKSDDATCTCYQITSMNSELDRKSMFTRLRVTLAFCLIWFEIWEESIYKKLLTFFDVIFRLLLSASDWWCRWGVERERERGVYGREENERWFSSLVLPLHTTRDVFIVQHFLDCYFYLFIYL